MTARPKAWLGRRGLAVATIILGATICHARTPDPGACKMVLLTGEVAAGQEWNSAIGDGWIFRIVPIVPGLAGYSGWDLVVDRAKPAGYPDALLLATLPYNSINEREVGTTFGLRAQDAIGWNPRSFRFLSSPQAFREGRQLFRSLSANRLDSRATLTPPQGNSADAQPLARLLDLQKQASTGKFSVLDARLVPGIGDAAPFAQNWSQASGRTPHQVDSAPAGKSSPIGSLNWIRFSITLWLPKTRNLPSKLHSSRSVCLQ